MSEWNKNSILDLIKEYKEHSNLYDSKHSLYYNKKARTQSLNKIKDTICVNRPNTTLEEVHKKIQTLRTQVGQELNKIEKSYELCDESLVYQPKVWWYEKFEWVAAFMKVSGRTEKSIKVEEPSRIEVINDEELPDNSDILLEEIIQEPEPKRPRRSFPKIVKSNSNISPQTQTIQYIISQEETIDNITSNDHQMLEIQPTSSSNTDNERYKKRSKGFGKYVASLMQDIKDDKVFFETQSEILRIIEQATFKSK